MHIRIYFPFRWSRVDMEWYIQIQYESMVSLESRRYMRGENGTESLMVC